MKILLGVFAAIALLIGFIFLQIPSEETLRGCITTKMFQVELCPTSKSYVPLSKISRAVRKAVVSSEDSLFYQHEGFDWESIKKSYEENRETGKIKRGGSTITQQLAKNMFLSKSKTISRKGIEALITWKIEKTLSKDEILEKYLNVIEYGEGIYGIKKASQHYFKKHPSEIDVAEAAFLAMLLPNPVKYSSSFKKKDLTPFAKRRISTIVRNLYVSGQISQTEYQAAVGKLSDFFGIRPNSYEEDDGAALADEPPTLENPADAFGEPAEEAPPEVSDPQPVTPEPVSPAEEPVVEEPEPEL